MAAKKLVSGSGWISDDSDFYGDEESVKKLIRLARTKRALAVNPPWPESIRKGRQVNRTSTSFDWTTNALDHVPPDRGVGVEVAQNTERNAPLLLKTSPQAAVACDSLALAGAKTPIDGLGLSPATRKQDETVDAFLKRLPVASPDTAKVGPWLWVHSPFAKKPTETQMKLDAFKSEAVFALDKFEKCTVKIEKEHNGKAAATVARKIRPYREQLEEDLLSSALRNGVTCGKWMLFPSTQDLPHYWRLVAEATAAGKLGPISKVGTYDPSNGKDATLICVYTRDFSNMDDVRRIVEELVNLDLVREDSRPIYYKCDAYAHLEIESSNDYKIRASLWSSKDVLERNIKVLEEGPMARLRRRRRESDSSRKL